VRRTAAERRAYEALTRAARRTAPGIAQSLLAGMRALADRLDYTAIARLIETGGVEALMREVFSAERVSADLVVARTDIRHAIERGGSAQLRAILPTGAVAFDAVNPLALAALGRVEAVSIGPYGLALRDTIRQAVQDGLAAGTPPRTIARGLREVIGLAPTQRQWVENYRAALEAGDYSKALGYQLRDKRSDRLLARLAGKGGDLDAAAITRLTDAYRRKLTAYHAEVVARQAALDAYREGQRAALDIAIEAGALDPDRAMKRWVYPFVSQEPRPEHVALNGVAIPLRDPWPVDGGVQVPGQNAYGCRCSQVYFLRPRPAA
jgi:hypothetical protein